jgi:hypothetical protein
VSKRTASTDLLNEALSTLEQCQRLFKEALPKFNWAESALDANAIQLLNAVPNQTAATIARIKGDKLI